MQIETFLKIVTGSVPDTRDLNVVRVLTEVFTNLTNNQTSKNGWDESNLFVELYRNELIENWQVNALNLILSTHMSCVYGQKSLYTRSAEQSLSRLRQKMHETLDKIEDLKGVGSFDDVMAIYFCEAMHYYFWWERQFTVTQVFNQHKHLRNVRSVYDQVKEKTYSIGDRSLVRLYGALEYMGSKKTMYGGVVLAGYNTHRDISTRDSNGWDYENYWATAWMYLQMPGYESRAEEFLNKAKEENSQRCLFVPCW